ncbi:MAG: (Fe-S)-binding protein [Candidatus Electrothrix sp. YB6]
MPPAQTARHAATCLECGLCVRECAFLQKYGTPKSIACSWHPEKDRLLPFECSLCGLCAAVCPPKINLNPAVMFLEMRQELVRRGAAPLPQHRRLLTYERRGVSARYAWCGLPERCDTVLFPGCAFAGTRSGRLLELFQHLSRSIPNLGIMLDCCTKPSHDLGRTTQFTAMFGRLRHSLVAQGIRRVLVICPSCYAVFRQYGAPLEVQFVYELLAEMTLPVDSTAILGQQVTVHDPCATRQHSQVHEAVRALLRQAGLEITEMPHHGRTTLCCGEGGAIPFLNNALARRWGDRRQQEAGSLPAVTYCAGCVQFLRSRLQTVHLLDLLFAPAHALHGRVRVARAPLTYLNRLFLKRRLQKLLSD